jgi:hypothetical protein
MPKPKLNQSACKAKASPISARPSSIGLRESVRQFQDATGVNATEVLRLVLLTQYFDTLKEIGVSAGSKVIMLPHAPAGMADIADQITKAIITGEEATGH